MEYNNLLQEAYCTLQFDYYNSVIDKCLNDLERDAPGLKYHSVMELAKKKVKGDDGEDCIDRYLYKLAETYMKDEPVEKDFLAITRKWQDGLFRNDSYVLGIIADTDDLYGIIEPWVIN